MKKLDKNRIMAIIFGVVIIVGITGYFSLGGFIKPVLSNLVFGVPREMKSGNSLSDALNKSIDSVDALAEDYVSFKSSYIDLNSYLQNNLGFKEIKCGDETVVKLDNGYLAYDYDGADDETLKNDVSSLVSLKEHLDTSGIRLLFYLTPNKTQPGNSLLPNGLCDNLNISADKFLSLLDETSVEYVDFRKEIADEYTDYYSCFYKTDHHWTSRTGFWAFKKICNNLSELCNFKYDEKITNLSNYNIQTYKNWFLGSQGKKVGSLFAGTDDIDIITPKFETSLEETQPLKPDYISRKGDFTEALMKMDFVKVKDLYNLNPYVSYNGGDFAYQVIKNNNAINNKKILVVRDSYANTVTPFLSLAVKEMHIFDLRENVTRFKIESLQKYIDEIHPDAVVFLYSPLRLNNDYDEFSFK